LLGWQFILLLTPAFLLALAVIVPKSWEGLVFLALLVCTPVAWIGIFVLSWRDVDRRIGSRIASTRASLSGTRRRDYPREAAFNSEVTPMLTAGTGLEDEARSDTSYRLAAVPLGAMRYTTVRERLGQWRELRDAPKFREDPRIATARTEERILGKVVSVHRSTQHGHVFSNKRIPRDVTAAAMGRCEADLIVMTPRRVVLIEVKNWSGRLEVRGDQWVQVRRNGVEVAHDNLLMANRDKLLALKRYLEHNGIDIPTGRFHQAIVFAHPGLALDPVLRGHPAILDYAVVGDVLGDGTGLGQRAAAKLIDWAASEEMATALHDKLLDVIPPMRLKAAAEAVSSLRTWDLLTLRGGRVLQGDLLWLRAGERTFDQRTFEPGGDVRLRWRRDDLGLVSWVLFGAWPGEMDGVLFKRMGSLPDKRIPLRIEDCVGFHEVGLPVPSTIHLSDIERIRLG
jgi:hypothetical protein